ncbi:mediator of RNA polymerase II transcription subunit 11-like [Lolium rigidum]|uniref:mediator of RNA polymerase II transcription subunit 11-like n=1 Tax=Lolium rigidum TaxID=89674 RepID=UPI001F5C7DD0|nr:mediator of RNA polymerase II transcription subunit 11-like [Lolium rigidum]
MVSQGRSSSLQRLHHIEKRILLVVELAGAVMEELGNSQGTLTDAVSGLCRKFMLFMKQIQTILCEEIKTACEYRPFEKCDYSARIANEICCKKLDYENLRKPITVLTLLLPSWSRAKRPVRKLKPMLPLSKIFDKDFMMRKPV